MMKFLTSLITITAKLSLLGCFVLMNGNCFATANAVTEPHPCHAKHITQQNKKHHKEPCSQCKISQKAWSSPAVFQTLPTETQTIKWASPAPFWDIETFPVVLQEILPTHDPPDKLFTQTYPRIFRSTRWNTSGR